MFVGGILFVQINLSSWSSTSCPFTHHNRQWFRLYSAVIASQEDIFVTSILMKETVYMGSILSLEHSCCFLCPCSLPTPLNKNKRRRRKEMCVHVCIHVFTFYCVLERVSCLVPHTPGQLTQTSMDSRLCI